MLKKPCMEGVNETYEEMRRLVQGTLGKFVRQKPMDWDAAMAAAGYGYTVAVNTYSLKKGALSTWVVFKVWKELESARRVEARRATKLKRDGEPVDPDTLFAKEEVIFDEEEFASKLSPDGQMVLWLVLHSPLEILVDIAEKGGWTPARMRFAVSRFLKRSGWSRERILQTFQEVRDHL